MMQDASAAVQFYMDLLENRLEELMKAREQAAVVDAKYKSERARALLSSPQKTEEMRKAHADFVVSEMYREKVVQEAIAKNWADAWATAKANLDGARTLNASARQTVG